VTATELLARISEAGGKLRLRDSRLYAKGVPECLVPDLKRLKPELIRYLRLEAASDTFSPAYVFPHCPRCSSYSLYRKNNRGDYQCMTCELTGISEIQAVGASKRNRTIEG